MEGQSGNEEIITLLDECNKTLHSIAKSLQILVTAAQAANPDVFPNAKVNRDRKKR